MTELEDKDRIREVLDTYARACDRRDWPLLDQVFAGDAQANYGGEYLLQGRDQIVAMISRMLGGCGPTQHLLGNYAIAVEGDRANSACYVRAAHVGLGDKSGLFYEVWAEYQDELVRSDEGWRITRREMRVDQEMGAREVLAP